MTITRKLRLGFVLAGGAAVVAGASGILPLMDSAQLVKYTNSPVAKLLSDAGREAFSQGLWVTCGACAIIVIVGFVMTSLIARRRVSPS